MSKIFLKTALFLLIISFFVSNVRSQNSYGWERIFNSVYGINGFYKTEKNPNNNQKIFIVRSIGDLFGTGNYDYVKYSEASNRFYPACNSIFKAFYFFGVVGGNHYSGYSFPINIALSNTDSNFAMVNNNNSDLYYGLPNIRLLYSYNNGITTTEILPFHGLKFFGLTIDPNMDSIIYASHYSSNHSVICKSIDRGISWVANDTITTFSGNLLVNPILSNYVYGYKDSLYISSDGGNNFEFASTNSFTQLAYNYTDSSIFATEKNKLYKSIDYGYTWIMLDSLADTINVLEIDIDNETIIYAGTKRGLYKSTNGGMSFNLFNNSFSPSLRIIGLSKDSGRNYIYVVTEEAVYKCWNSYVVDIENTSSIIPGSFKLEQNYPNPFNPITTISYSIPSSLESPNVEIRVYDILGNNIATLINKKQNFGIYEIDFDASDYPSGVYFYTLAINNKLADAKRMMLIK